MCEFSESMVDHAVSYEVLPDGDELPTCFRLFRAGVNHSSKGDSVFDEVSARSVMGVYQVEGTDIMVDLDHDSLNERARIARSNAAEAVGWFQLALRGGELWAENVRWNACGADQLRGKKRRYTSPAFLTDDSGRVIRLVNVALTGMPATYGALPLVAASRQEWSTMNIDPSLVQKAIDALTAGDGNAALEILTAMVVAAAGGDAKTEEPPAEEPASGAPDVGGVALAKLSELVGTSDPGAIVERVQSLVAAEAVATRNRLALEAGQRGELVARLVALHAETPTTAFSGGQIVERLSREPLDSLRARVVALSETAPAPAPRPPSGGSAAQTGSVADIVTRGMTADQKARFAQLQARRVG